MHLFEKDIVFEVDLDEERKVEVKEGRPPNRHRVIIRKTNKVNLSTLKFYLDGKASFDNSVLEAISKTFPVMCAPLDTNQQKSRLS